MNPSHVFDMQNSISARTRKNHWHIPSKRIFCFHHSLFVVPFPAAADKELSQ